MIETASRKSSNVLKELEEIIYQQRELEVEKSIIIDNYQGDNKKEQQSDDAKTVLSDKHKMRKT